MKEFKDLTFERDGGVYCGERRVIEVVPDETYSGMYRVRWPDGVVSADFYNLARAKVHAGVAAVRMLNDSWGVEGTQEAHLCEISGEVMSDTGENVEASQ